jgi:hypothetical protein
VPSVATRGVADSRHNSAGFPPLSLPCPRRGWLPSRPQGGRRRSERIGSLLTREWNCEGANREDSAAERMWPLTNEADAMG